MSQLTTFRDLLYDLVEMSEEHLDQKLAIATGRINRYQVDCKMALCTDYHYDIRYLAVLPDVPFDSRAKRPMDKDGFATDHAPVSHYSDWEEK